MNSFKTPNHENNSIQLNLGELLAKTEASVNAIAMGSSTIKMTAMIFKGKSWFSF